MVMYPPAGDKLPSLHRHFNLLHATALNVSMIVGAGVFVTIPLMLVELPGPEALLGWVLAGLLMLMDGLIWSELGAAFPQSGGTYQYLLQCYGPDRWGRLMAFLFVWQFLLSGPLEIASAFIAMAIFTNGLHPEFAAFNKDYALRIPPESGADLGIVINPARIMAFAIGLVILFLLYRRISSLGRFTIAVWLGVLGVIIWILADGFLHYGPTLTVPQNGAVPIKGFWSGLGGAMALAMYSYLGYYNVCFFADEVRDPGRTIPRAILISAVVVGLLFVGLHLAMLGTVPWHEARTQYLEAQKQGSDYNLPADFMARLHGQGAAVVVTLFLIWSCFGSAYAGLLGYSRIPYGAARYGHFFSFLGQVHLRHHIPHRSLILVGGLALFWTFFDLESVIKALVITRIVEQFIAQIIGVMWLRRKRPDLARPYRIWLYPWPCLLALAGWLYMYLSADFFFILLGLATLAVGTTLFLFWSWQTKQWPFRYP